MVRLKLWSTVDAEHCSMNSFFFIEMNIILTIAYNIVVLWGFCMIQSLSLFL